MLKDSVAFCGLFCESCGVYIATRKDENELEKIALRMGTSKEEMRCNGCRSNILSPHCRNCHFRACARERGLDNCEDCSEFPCPELISFQKQMPHRTELFESARYRKDHGVDQWIIKMIEDYSCSNCGEINSPYYVKCRKCGHEPVNQYSERNIEVFKKKTV